MLDKNSILENMQFFLCGNSHYSLPGADEYGVGVGHLEGPDRVDDRRGEGEEDVEAGGGDVGHDEAAVAREGGEVGEVPPGLHQAGRGLDGSPGHCRRCGENYENGP